MGLYTYIYLKKNYKRSASACSMLMLEYAINSLLCLDGAEMLKHAEKSCDA